MARPNLHKKIVLSDIDSPFVGNNGKFNSATLDWSTDSTDSTDSRKRKFIDLINSQALKLRYLRISKQTSQAISEISDEDRTNLISKLEDVELDTFKTSIKNQINMKHGNLRIRELQEQINIKTTTNKMKTNSLKETQQTSSKVYTKRKFGRKNLIKKSEMFHQHIMKVAQNNKRKAKLEKRRILLSERETNLNLYQQVTVLRYRENVFKAASTLSKNLSPFPSWSYRNKTEASMHTIKINVGGTKFEVFDETLMNLPHTKLADSYLFQCKDSTMFFDRDFLCFNAVLNFYRTGRLHAPANSCLSFFEEELMFWGLNEDFIEPCCISDYQANRRICQTLDNYMESMKLPVNEFGKKSCYDKSQTTCNLIAISETNSLFSRWYVFIYGLAIVTTILTLVFSTTKLGRVDKITKEMSDFQNGETEERFIRRTEPTKMIFIIDKLLDGFFLLDFLMRFIFYPDKLIFWADLVNWCDLFVIISSTLSDIPTITDLEQYEAYLIVFKVPRLFRIFRVTKHLRVGMDAFILTLRGSTSELLLVFIITVVAICFFGVTIYVVELINEQPDRYSQFKSIVEGMWWAIGTLATVGYGDFVPQSFYGYIVGYFCILTGIIITQLPVPIFLNRFSIYYNQIEARMKLVDAVINSNIDPEAIKFPELKSGKEQLTLAKLNEEASSESTTT